MKPHLAEALLATDEKGTSFFFKDEAKRLPILQSMVLHPWVYLSEFKREHMKLEGEG